MADDFDDPYFSLEDGLAETRHTFLAGNGLPERFRPGFHIAELGFGTGLNAAAALSAWRRVGIEGPLRFTSFEAAPMPGDAMARALRRWPELEDAAQTVIGAATGATVDTDLHLEIIIGDARETLPRWTGRADAWFLDGFAPAKNPELWEASLLREVARHTAQGGSAATYTAAGAVRAALAEAGFVVERVEGYGRKRHMTRARLP